MHNPYIKILITALLAITCCCCNNSQPAKPAQTPAKPVTVSIDSFYIDSSEVNSNYYKQYPDTSNQLIYDFMAVVINNRNLDLHYGLLEAPSQDFSIDYHDKNFLETLLIKKEPPVKTATLNETIVPAAIEVNRYDKCLTRKDINTMLQQKEMNRNMRWNNSRLGFDLVNHKNFYSFSVPVFSADRKKVVIKISDLCPGLCGTSETVLFKMENGKWISQSGSLAFH